MQENNLYKNYQQYLDWWLDIQKDVGTFDFDCLYPIIGPTGSGKSFLINQLTLPSLFSYKYSEFPFEAKWKQIPITKEKFNQMLENGLFFDVYQEDNKYYWYSVIDYFILKKEFGKVYIEISPQNYFSWLRYKYSRLIIINPTKEQLIKNILKRAKERNYDEHKIGETIKQQEIEKKLIEKIIEQNPQSIILDSMDLDNSDLVKTYLKCN